MMRRWALLALLGVSCNDLPAVAPERFACVADTVAVDGAYECPASHYCAENSCTPRLNCLTDDRLGCTPESTRCELSSTADRAAVSCQPGIFTVTSTPVRDLDACPCPDGLACTALATLSTTVTDALAYPLFIFPSSLRPARLPIGPLGIRGEIERARTCTKPCGSEVDCGAGYTCRAATVLEGRASGGADLGRHTVGVCFPDLLTTTTTAAEQPDPGLCRTQADCTVAAGRFEGHCKAGVEVIPDRPRRRWLGRPPRHADPLRGGRAGRDRRPRLHHQRRVPQRRLRSKPVRNPVRSGRSPLLSGGLRRRRGGAQDPERRHDPGSHLRLLPDLNLGPGAPARGERSWRRPDRFPVPGALFTFPGPILVPRSLFPVPGPGFAAQSEDRTGNRGQQSERGM